MIGMGGPNPVDGSGYISFFGDGAADLNDDGRVYLHIGSSGHGQYARFSLDRHSFLRFISTAMTNARLVNEAFKPVGLLLTPLDGTEPIRCTATALTLKDGKVIVEGPDGPKEYDALMYAISYDYGKPAVPVADDEDL